MSRDTGGTELGDGIEDFLIAGKLESQGVMSIEETNDPAKNDVVQRVLDYLLGE